MLNIVESDGFELVDSGGQESNTTSDTGIPNSTETISFKLPKQIIAVTI